MTLLLDQDLDNAILNQTFSVPGHYATLQEAIDDLGHNYRCHNCIIEIAAHVTTEQHVLIDGNHHFYGITIRGNDTLAAQSGNGRVSCGSNITVRNHPFRVFLDSLQFNKPSGIVDEQTGIYVVSSNVRCENIGVSASFASAATAIACYGGYLVTTAGCELLNHATGIISNTASVDCDNTTINASMVGLRSRHGGALTATNSTIFGAAYGALCVSKSGMDCLRGTFITTNNIGILCERASLLVVNGANVAGGTGDAIRLQRASSGSIVNSTVHSSSHYGVRALYEAVISLSNVSFYANSLGNVLPATAFTFGTSGNYRVT